MDQFNLTIFRQNRVILIVFLIPVFIITALLFASVIKTTFLKILLPLIFLSLIGFSLFYYAVGYLTIIAKDRKLEFHWQRKIIFNYRIIDPANLDQIKTLVIDQDRIVRKIIMNDREIILGNGNLLRKDASRFIDYLLKETQSKKIDSWDVWKEQGWLTIAYRVNTIILGLSIVILTIYAFVKGFNYRLFMFMPLMITQLLLYQGQMRRKLKN